MVKVIFIFIYLYCRNPKFFQKDLLFCFCKILNNGSEQLIMSLLYTLLCEQLFLWNTSSCCFDQPEVLLLGTQGLCQGHCHTMLGPRLMWSPFLPWIHPEHSYLDHFLCYLLTKAVIPNKLCYESLTRYAVLIFVLQLQEKAAGSRIHTRHSFCPWWALCFQGAHGLHHFLAVFYDSSLSQPFLNISWALGELSLELVIPDIAGSCPCCLVEVTSVKIIDLSLEQQETCWKEARTALNFSSEGQGRVNQYFPPFPKKEQSSVSMDSHTFSFFLLSASCYLKILITLTVRESVLKEPAESIHPE